MELKHIIRPWKICGRGATCSQVQYLFLPISWFFCAAAFPEASLILPVALGGPSSVGSGTRCCTKPAQETASRWWLSSGRKRPGRALSQPDPAQSTLWMNLQPQPAAPGLRAVRGSSLCLAQSRACSCREHLQNEQTGKGWDESCWSTLCRALHWKWLKIGSCKSLELSVIEKRI